ncbi:Gamma-glutamyltranspeptidase 1 [Bulinus truncatus]|nr:Gamma-glutamyltranspeptidase 1 [Bulinus truncatus]
MSQPPNGYRTFCESAITADTSLASTVGRDILRMGGNAVDAAIATLICSGLTSPQSMGIAATYNTAASTTCLQNYANDNKTFIDAREAAPAGVDAGQPLEGPLRIAVPGEIKGYWYAHRKYGRLPWSDLFQPSIKFAEKGFPVPIGLQKALTEENENVLANEPLRQTDVFRVTIDFTPVPCNSPTDH